MFDRLLNLPPAQRRLIYFGTTALIFVIYFFSFYSPAAARVYEKEQEATELRNTLAELRSVVVDQDDVQASIREIQGEFNRVQAQLPGQKEIPELLRQVSNLGRDSGLEVLLFRQQPEKFEELYAAVPVEMSVRGGFHQVGLFFDKVGQLDRIVNISDISMKNPKTLNGDLTIDASFSATTYRFLSKEERERIAKEKEAAEKDKR